MTNTSDRFSDRVSNYIKYRPSYPQAVVDTIIAQCHPVAMASVADIGSGTGIFSKLLLERNFRVIGVEPNQSMREAAQYQLASYENFSSIDGQAERSNLASASIDLITAAQAFHWFERAPARREFARILKPGGCLALVWNQRKIEQPFQKEYDAILREYATDYNDVNHMNITPEDIDNFYKPGRADAYSFENTQQFDLSGLLGRMRSSSFTPKENTRELQIMLAVTEALFNKYARNGVISFDYETRLYVGNL